MIISEIVFGTETEFTLIDKHTHEPRSLEYLIESLLRESDNTLLGHSFYDDGFWEYGRLYDDNPFIEASTVECTDPKQVAEHERYLEQFLTQILAEAGYLEDHYLTRQSGVRAEEKTYSGYHENYSTPKELRHLFQHFYRPQVGRIASFLATRPVWAGSGITSVGNTGLTERSGITKAVQSSEYTVGPSLFQLKFAPDKAKVPEIIEIRSGNASKTHVERTIGFTALFLIALSQKRLSNIMLAEPLEVFQRLSRFSMYTPFVEWQSKRTITPIDHQLMIADALQATEAPEHLLGYAQQVYDACDTLKAYAKGGLDFSKLTEYTEWAAHRKHLQAHKAEPHEGWLAVPLDEKVQLNTPELPPTRARERARLMQEFGGRIISVDWNGVVLDRSTGRHGKRSYKLPKPHGGNVDASTHPPGLHF